jgi:hypothetical protein
VFCPINPIIAELKTTLTSPLADGERSSVIEIRLKRRRGNPELLLNFIILALLD